MPEKKEPIVIPEIKVNVDDAINHLNIFKSSLARYLHVALTESMDIVGLRATSKYMIHTKMKWSKTKSGKSKKKLEGVIKGGSLLNIRTGRLARSINRMFSYAQGMGGENEGIRIIKHSGHEFIGVLGTKVPYAAIHEFGGTIRRGNKEIKIPKRSYLGRAINDDFTKRKINQLFSKYMQKWVKRYGK